MNPDEPLLLTMAEVTSRLGISFYLVKCETRSGRLRSVKIGSRRMIPTSALAEYIHNCLDEEDQDREEHLIRLPTYRD